MERRIHLGTVRPWDPNTGVQLSEDGSHGAGVGVVAFSPDGSHVMSGRADGSVRITPCDACGSLDTLLALAKARTVRPLTAEEAGRFLLEGE